MLAPEHMAQAVETMVADSGTAELEAVAQEPERMKALEVKCR